MDPAEAGHQQAGAVSPGPAQPWPCFPGGGGRPPDQILWRAAGAAPLAAPGSCGAAAGAAGRITAAQIASGMQCIVCANICRADY